MERFRPECRRRDRGNRTEPSLRSRARQIVTLCKYGTLRFGKEKESRAPGREFSIPRGLFTLCNALLQEFTSFKHLKRYETVQIVNASVADSRPPPPRASIPAARLCSMAAMISHAGTPRVLTDARRPPAQPFPPPMHVEVALQLCREVVPQDFRDRWVARSMALRVSLSKVRLRVVLLVTFDFKESTGNPADPRGPAHAPSGWMVAQDVFGKFREQCHEEKVCGVLFQLIVRLATCSKFNLEPNEIFV